MKKFRLNLYRNKNLFLLIGMLIVHLFFSAIFYHYKIPFLVIYNCFIVILYGALARMLTPKRIFSILVVISIEVPLYALLTGLLLGPNSGTIFFSYAMISGVYLYSVSLDRPLYHYILLSLPAVFTVFFLLVWNKPPIYNLATVNPTFMGFHRIACIVISIFALGYLSIGQQKELVSTRRANIKYIERLQFISDHDPLTQIPNRRYINRQLSLMREYTIVIFDIDNFKSINDTYGHLIGDQILCRLTRRVLSMLPDTALMGRWGGEEFLIVFPYLENGIKEKLESIRCRIADKPFGFENFNLNVTITAGVSWYSSENSTEEVIAEADFLLYHGKKTGKNKVVFPTDVA